MADRFVFGTAPSTTARQFSASPPDSTLRWTPCPPVVFSTEREVQVLPLVRSRGFPLRAHLGFSISHTHRLARHYPRFWIWRPSSGRQRDFNPPDQCAAQRTMPSADLCPPILPSHDESSPKADGQISPGIAHQLSSHMPVAYTPIPSEWLSGFESFGPLAQR